MRRALATFLISVVVLIVAAGLMSREFGSRPSNDAIMVFCAASNRGVMQQVASDYFAETGRRVVVQYSASQTLLGAIEISRTGDLYLPADSSYIELAREKELVLESMVVARQTPVLVVEKESTLNVDSLQALLASNARIVLANPEVAAVGRATQLALADSGLWEQLREQTTALRPMVTDVANDVLIGAADAGIIYDSLLHNYPDLRPIRVPELEDAFCEVSVCVLKHSRKPQIALDFARYLSSPEGGLRRYQEFGFQVLVPDS